VMNIKKIGFSPLPFQSLTIPEEKKEVIMGIAESQVSQTKATLDDVVIRKGLGVSVLLQYEHLS
jgi:hypothetical protein